MPESARFYVVKGEMDKAEKVIRRIAWYKQTCECMTRVYFQKSLKQYINDNMQNYDNYDNMQNYVDSSQYFVHLQCNTQCGSLLKTDSTQTKHLPLVGVCSE